MLAAEDGLAPVVEALLARGAAPALANGAGKTALELARERGRDEMVARLLAVVR
jgi:ankyrin repeat protein